MSHYAIRSAARMDISSTTFNYKIPLIISPINYEILNFNIGIDDKPMQLIPAPQFIATTILLFHADYVEVQTTCNEDHTFEVVAMS